MYSEGYLHQHVLVDGWQEGIKESLDRDAAPARRVVDESGNQLVIRVPHIEPPIYVAVWKVDVGKVPLYLLDTDIALNDDKSRRISSNLYTSTVRNGSAGDRARVRRQEGAARDGDSLLGRAPERGPPGFCAAGTDPGTVNGASRMMRQ
jgi:starch phosphorylase